MTFAYLSRWSFQLVSGISVLSVTLKSTNSAFQTEIGLWVWW